MSVYFVYRSHYEGPSGKHVRRLDADSVLGWYQAVWERAKQAEDISEWVKAEVGADVYGFASIFEAARDHSLPPPTSDRKLKSYLEEHLYVEGEMRFKPHALQVLTDDDEIELAYYFFDDHYLNEHAGRTAYLLHEGWRLPTSIGKNPKKPSVRARAIQPHGSGSGLTYLAFLACYDSSALSDLDEIARALSDQRRESLAFGRLPGSHVSRRGLAVRVEAASLPDARRRPDRGSAQSSFGASRRFTGHQHR